MVEKRSTILRRLIGREKVLWTPLVYDCISARIFEHAGFEAVSVSGYGVSVSLLGMPDMGFISLPEITMVARHIANCVQIPVIADADTGFGNALNVLRTTKDFIQSGVAAISIEDQVAPKRCGHVAGKQVISLEEAVGKFMAADHVRKELDPDFVIIARTDARGAIGGNLEEAIKRANSYIEAGADVAFVEAIVSVEELQCVLKGVKAPIKYNMHGISPIIPIKKLEEMGIAIVGFGVPYWVAAGAIWDYAHDLKKRGTEAQVEFFQRMKGHPLEEFNSFAGFTEMKRMEEKYLPNEEVLQKYQTTLGYKP
jgi:2-methylisocitrate lyase-like PEP mutase family enzyme